MEIENRIEYLENMERVYQREPDTVERSFRLARLATRLEELRWILENSDWGFNDVREYFLLTVTLVGLSGAFVGALLTWAVT
jgi:hypothetical protein